MPDESPENLEPEEFNPEQPGGPAVQPGQSFLGQKTDQAKSKVAQKAGQAAAKKVAGKAAGEGAADVVAAGTGGVGAILRPVIKWATEKIVNKLLSKDWWKVVLKLYWPQIATALIVIIISVVAITIIIRAYRGFWGRGQVQASSIYDSSVMGDIRVVLGEQIMVSNTPQNNYFSQGDPAFNQQPLNGHWENNEPYLKNAGCGITSCAMMMRYYGVTNVSPVQFANEMANGGSLALRPNFMLNYVNPVLKNQGKKERTITEITANVQTIAKYIQNGDPVLAHGNPICDSKGEHYVLIVGISKDFSKFVISDPAAGKPRQSAARFCSQSDLLGHIKQLIVLQ